VSKAVEDGPLAAADSSSAKPHVQFLHAFFLLKPFSPTEDGVQFDVVVVPDGLTRSASLNKDSSSISWSLDFKGTGGAVEGTRTDFMHSYVPGGSPMAGFDRPTRRQSRNKFGFI
jgi:hypothetical protein